MKFIVILNEKAGTASQASADVLQKTLRETFAAARVAAEVQMLAPEAIGRALREAVAARPDAVIIGGGDGTVRSAAAALADTGIPLGVLPLGTLNHFAKDIKMPADLQDAIVALSSGIIREVDVAEVNGHVFINNCSLGCYADAVRRRDALRNAHAQGKWWAMVRASFETFRRLRRMRLRVTLGKSQPRSVRTPVVVVGNNRYSGHVLDKSMRAHLDAGELWLYTAHVHRHLAALRMMLQSLLRRLDGADALVAESATEITIESERGPLPIAADGEVVDLQSPLRFRIRPRALRVLVPGDKEPALQ